MAPVSTSVLGSAILTHEAQNGEVQRSEPDKSIERAAKNLAKGDVLTRMFFLGRDELYETVKPYSIRYDVKVCIPQDNIRRVEHPVTVKDLRNSAEENDFGISGFMIRPIKSSMTYEDYNDEEKIRRIHIPEILAEVQNAFSADDIHALEYVVRRRHPTWPIATGDSYDFEQPASRAHIDFTHDAVVDIIRHLYEHQAEQVLAGRWQVINAWHPLRGPTRDWPLAVCDASTVNFEKDAVPGDIVQADRVTENLQIHFDGQQKWFYLSDQLPSEMLLFKNADSETPSGATSGAPHASFDLGTPFTNEVRRESIEVRILVMWKK